MNPTLRWLSLTGLAVALAVPALAQGGGTKPGLVLETEKLVVNASFEPATARPGETVQLVLGCTTIPGWHAYGFLEAVNVPVALDHGKVQFHGLEPVGEADIPAGEEKEVLGNLSYPLPEYFEVRQAVKVPEGTPAGEVKVEGLFDYQVCDENVCDRPAEAAFAATLTVEAGEMRSEFAEAPPPAPPAAGADDGPRQRGSSGVGLDSLWALILACIGGGLFALAMPCTYPMIPITFSFFTKQAEKRGGKVLPLAIIYGLGIITMFVIVGVALSSVIIPIVNHWLTNLVIGAVFLFFAFVLFGWINLNPPKFLQNAAGKASRTGGLLGVFFMGAALVITSFTCTAPIVGTLIANVAEHGQVRVGLGMAIFGLTMAIPFVALALTPTKVNAMPRSGEWMETLKVSLGFIELAAVLKFVSMVDIALGWSLLNRELFLMLNVAVFMLWAMYLFGFLRKAGQPYEGVGAGRQATGMFAVLFAAYLFTGTLGYRLDFFTTSFVPPYSADLVLSRGGGGGDEDAKPKGHTIVKDDPARAVEVAKQEDKLLLYNFTGFN